MSHAIIHYEFDEASTTLDRIIEPASHSMTVDAARWLATLQPDPEVEELLDELSERNTEGLLSDSERAEYETLVRAGSFMAILRAKARKVLALGDSRGGHRA